MKTTFGLVAVLAATAATAGNPHKEPLPVFWEPACEVSVSKTLEAAFREYLVVDINVSDCAPGRLVVEWESTIAHSGKIYIVRNNDLAQWRPTPNERRGQHGEIYTQGNEHFTLFYQNKFNGWNEISVLVELL